MGSTIMQLSGINMSYGYSVVLGGLDFTLQKGEICGLIGPNGAGKTTLLKIITGLVKPQQGEVRLFDKEFEPALLRRTGCLIEKPALYNSKSAQENLQMHAALLGMPETNINELLKQAGLSDTGKKRAGRFSLGMKQRLGIAMALMGNPDLLMLDEPFNGLDTQGRYDIRELLQDLNHSGGVTIIITSHNLDEIARICSSYALLKNGALEKFNNDDLRERTKQYAVIVTGSPKDAAVVLDGFCNGADGYEIFPDGSIRLYEGLERIAEINAALVKAGVAVRNLSVSSRSLTDFYLQETGGEDHHA